MATIFVGSFDNKQNIINCFEADALALDGADLLYAEYDNEDYDGSAVVIFKRDGKLWAVYGSHCSCDGLEGQWEPEETTWEELLKYIEPDEDDEFAKFVRFNANMN